MTFCCSIFLSRSYDACDINTSPAGPAFCSRPNKSNDPSDISWTSKTWIRLYQHIWEDLFKTTVLSNDSLLPSLTHKIWTILVWPVGYSLRKSQCICRETHKGRLNLQYPSLLRWRRNWRCGCLPRLGDSVQVGQDPTQNHILDIPLAVSSLQSLPEEQWNQWTNSATAGVVMSRSEDRTGGGSKDLRAESA